MYFNCLLFIFSSTLYGSIMSFYPERKSKRELKFQWSIHKFIFEILEFKSRKLALVTHIDDIFLVLVIFYIH